ncbi:hypothetical protein LINPERPRIM_LOCUS42481 [Linum perenne]
MVVPLRPAKFYGSSLPRPRFFNSERVEPPVSIMDPFLSWAEEAHWSMGGLNTQRVRHQGRIEGNIENLRKFREKQTGNTPKKKRAGSISPPPAPRVMKKRKFMDLFDDEEEESEKRKWPARKLVAEFDRVAKKSEEKGEMGRSESVGVRTRRNGLDSVMNVVEELSKKGSERKRLRKAGEVISSVRSSPRLSKQKSL